MIGASVLLLVLALDGRLGPSDGAILFGLMLAYATFLVVQARRQGRAADAQAAADGPQAAGGGWDRHWPVQLAMIVVGLGALVLGAQWLVDAAVAFARMLGASEVVIGLTIVALGTSMPEIATSIAAAIKGERDIAVGNVVGSNIFNILGCLGLSSLAAGATGLAVAPSLLAFDMWVMIAAALACLPVFVTGREIARWEGGVLLALLTAYVAYVLLAQQQHDALPAFSAAMMSFVIPLALVTLVAMLLRRPRAP